MYSKVSLRDFLSITVISIRMALLLVSNLVSVFVLPLQSSKV